MLSIGITEFRSNMNTILQRVQAGEIVSLQLRGTEIAKIVPPEVGSELAMAELQRLRATAVIGDVLSPVDEPWEVLRDSD